MKPYITNSGKSSKPYFWGDKVKPKIKRIFKKSVRQENKKMCYG